METLPRQYWATFQYQKGAIKTGDQLRAARGGWAFQYQKGAIKTGRLLGIFADLLRTGFNTKKVRLKRRP